MRIILVVALLFSQSLWAADCKKWLIDFHGGTDGTQLTTNLLNSCVQGTGFNWELYHASQLYGAITFSAAAQKLTLATLCDSTLVGSGSEFVGMSQITSNTTSPPYWIMHDNSPSSTSATCGFWFKTDMPPSCSPNPNIDIVAIFASNGGFINFDLISSGTKYSITLENTGGAANPSTGYVLDANTLYWATGAFRYDAGTGTRSNMLQVYSTNLVLIGGGKTAFSGTPSAAEQLRFGIHSIFQICAGYTCQWDGLRVDFSDTPEWPLLPLTLVPTINATTLNFDRIVRAQ